MNPFDALGLPASGDLSDEQVRRAWRKAAAAAHPDAPGGGDPAAYATVAAAYGQLRTGWGRGEALADLADSAAVPSPEQRAPGIAVTAWRSAAQLPARVRHGRPGRLALRTLAAIGVAVLAQALIPGTPSAPADITGAALWWVLTARSDLAPPHGR